MSQKHFQISYQLIRDPGSLSESEQALLAAAWEATASAYAPYSRFRVGCAVALEGGAVILGNNQENRAYPSGLCAERVALFQIGAMQQAKAIHSLAIRVHSERREVTAPVLSCGACRQVMAEYEEIAGRDFIILAQGSSGAIIRLEGVRRSLLPFQFDIDFL